MPDLDALQNGFKHGDRLALAKLLSRIANGESLPALPPPSKTARVIAVTGSAGVGKSTLIGKLIDHLRGLELKVAVLACDPQSPLTGGALLGDRFRMPTRPDDDGVFIRSLAALSGRGAIAEHLPGMVHLLEAFGFDVILIETVGAGQGDTAVHELADVVVLLLQPETGDDLQWEKAGVLEVADVIAIHKADLPGADQTAAQVRAALDLPGIRPIPVLLVSAKTCAGMEELWKTIAACDRRRDTQREAERDLLRVALAAVTRQFEAAAQQGNVKPIIEKWQAGRLSDNEAAQIVLRTLQQVL